MSALNNDQKQPSNAMSNPYDAPNAHLEEDDFDVDNVDLVGFWVRFVAQLIDYFVIALITLPLLYAIYGETYFVSDTLYFGVWDGLLNYLFPIAFVLYFWHSRQATPGKLLFGAKIVDATTGQKPSTGQLVGRYLAYIPSTLVFLLGYFWIAWDPKKQGWHDKLANTLVIKD